ncbi:DUF4129 domain-containing protein [Demequina sp. NBRC 110053]|uniref:DUF4129 domain-containing protein n=1 Tax=Demequina sp. NBRC 110053 TaxID=1570342 RepID=UPI001186D02E|nr:DUF4129 domain-containing protein [Demequina sp. NBRC 110053]
MRAAIPVDPDAETARDWAVDELARPEYRQGGDWSIDQAIQRVWEWLVELFERIGGVGDSVGIPGALFVALLATAAVALVTWLILGPLRRSRRRAAGGGVLDGDERSAREIRASAVGAHAAGDWDLAVMEWFRATVRTELERGAIIDSPGVTAHEAAVRIGAIAPGARADVAADASAFDTARYGSGGLGAADADHARATCEAISARRAEGAPA